MIKLNSENKVIFEDSTATALSDLEQEIEKSSINPFTLEDVIPHSRLNNLGLQVFRWLSFDQKMEEIRKKVLLLNSDYHNDLLNNGFIKIKNFLDQDRLKEIQRAVLSRPKILLTRNLCENIGINLEISSDERLQNIFKLCQGDNSYMEKNLYLRKISHIKPGEYTEDARQYNFHVDKFYPNFKVWFYPFDIEESSGPLACFRGSHKNTVAKMKWVYKRSVNNLDWSRLHYHVHDYKKIAEDLKLKEEIVCQAPSNTMFIVDTRMFHRRTPATINMLRLSFRAILKRNNLFKENH